MIGIDTNVLVRYVTQDDAALAAAALRLLKRPHSVFFVSDLVLIEMNWVLRSRYGWSAEEVVETVASLLAVQNMAFEDAESLRGALHAVRSGLDFADALIAARCRAQECHDFATFDLDLAKQLPQFAFVPK